LTEEEIFRRKKSPAVTIKPFTHWRMNMKKLQPTIKIGFAMAAALGLLLAMSIWPSAQKATGAALNGNPTAAAAVRVSVAFTIAKKSTNCTSGLGICNIKVGGSTTATRSATSREVNGALLVDDNGKLVCEFSSKLPEAGDRLAVEQALPLSEDLAKKLGLKSATIDQGSYSLSGGRALVSARLVK
jgi:hypothetical protein